MSTIAEKLALLLDTKTAIKNAIEAKGVPVGDIPFSKYPEKIQAISAAKPIDRRMVIVDVHACGVEAGETMELMFELSTQWLGWFDVLDDLTVRVSFEELSSMMGEDLEDHAGERFYIEASNNGECWSGTIPASGNIEAELV